jgi:hypothetical protein
MGYVGLLLALHFYVFGVLGVFLWRDNDPSHFRDLPASLLTLFRVITLEDWTDVMYIQMYGSDVYPMVKEGFVATEPVGRPLLAATYFVSFVLFGTMIMLNLFIGVVLNSMSQAERELEQSRKRSDAMEAPLSARDHTVAREAVPGGGSNRDEEIQAIENELAGLQHRLQRLRSPAGERSA